MHLRSLVTGSLILLSACANDRSPTLLDEPPASELVDGQVGEERDALAAEDDAAAYTAASADAALTQMQADGASTDDSAAWDGDHELTDGGQPDSVDASPPSYHVEVVITGLSGQTLALSLNGSGPLSVNVARFRLPLALQQGDAFELKVVKQPSSPSMVCTLLHASGHIDQADVVVEAHCASPGALRISEVGSCYYYDSACWVELYNAGATSQQLSDYALRTPAAAAVKPYGVQAEHVFALPKLEIGPGAYVVVAAASSGALPDGQGIVHIKEGSLLPWWSEDGFVELTSKQQTVDFLRFGDSRVSPRSEGTFQEDIPLHLPSSAAGYGYSLARNVLQADSNRSSDFAVRAFSTPHALNDVLSDLDSDDDGLPDSAEQPNGRFAGLPLYAMGARVGVRDLFVEIDRMSSTDPAVTPLREALDKLVSSFARQNIAIHPDVGGLFSTTFDPSQYNLGGGNVVPFAEAVQFRPTQAGVKSLFEYKAAHMLPERRAAFYYMLFGYAQEPDGKSGASGVGERPGNDTIITLGGYGFNTTSPSRRNLLANYQAATMMHELGHNLSLGHGGDESVNYKPNYLSVMNYLYGALGLPTIGTREGDRFDLTTGCSLFYLSELVNPPTGAPSQLLLDFSDGSSAPLDESKVDESRGLGRFGSRAVDYDCNGLVEDGYAADLNFDGKKSVLYDHDDWSALRFAFARSAAGNDSGPLLFTRWSLPSDVHLSDRQPLEDEPCPRVPVRTD